VRTGTTATQTPTTQPSAVAALETPISTAYMQLRYAMNQLNGLSASPNDVDFLRSRIDHNIRDLQDILARFKWPVPSLRGFATANGRRS
jgi:hypothetical protein